MGAGALHGPLGELGLWLGGEGSLVLSALQGGNKMTYVCQGLGLPEGESVVAALQGTAPKLQGCDMRSGRQGSRPALCKHTHQASQEHATLTGSAKCLWMPTAHEEHFEQWVACTLHFSTG